MAELKKGSSKLEPSLENETPCWALVKEISEVMLAPADTAKVLRSAPAANVTASVPLRVFFILNFPPKKVKLSLLSRSATARKPPFCQSNSRSTYAEQVNGT
jgi:hypothetical protein